MDPTGAGDSFAGGFLGYLSAQDDWQDEPTLRRAMTYGSVVASFNVEEFGTERVARLTREEIEERFEQFRHMTALEAAPRLSVRSRRVELPTFIWMFVVLKIPIIAALWLIWYAIQEPEPDDGRRAGAAAARIASPTAARAARARRAAARTRRPRRPRPPRADGEGPQPHAARLAKRIAEPVRPPAPAAQDVRRAVSGVPARHPADARSHPGGRPLGRRRCMSAVACGSLRLLCRPGSASLTRDGAARRGRDL